MTKPGRTVNLIPRKRRAARRVSRCLSSWAIFGVVYLIVVAGLSAIVIAITAPAHDPLERDAPGIAAQIAAAKDRLTQTRAELMGITRRLAASREVQGHPDWSVLLSLIAAKRGDGLLLASIELRPLDARAQTSPGAASATSGRPTMYTLRLSGLGKDHSEVAQFALRLENADVFSQVVLKDTVAKQLATKTVVSFGIECTLRDAPGFAGAEK